MSRKTNKRAEGKLVDDPTYKRFVTGEVGRLGLLITPEYCPRVRLCKVFTDLPLSGQAYRLRCASFL